MLAQIIHEAAVDAKKRSEEATRKYLTYRSEIFGDWNSQEAVLKAAIE